MKSFAILILVFFASVPCLQAEDAVPVVSPTYPLADSYIPASPPTIYFNIACSDGSAVLDNSVEVFLDTLKLTATKVDDGIWTAAVTWQLADGPHFATVAAIGLNGQPGGLKWNFTIDSLEPYIGIIFPANLGFVVSGNNYAAGVIGNLNDQTYSYITAMLDNASEMTVTSTFYNPYIGDIWMSLGDLNPGWHTLELTLVSRSGISATTSVTFKVLPPLPVPIITTPGYNNFYSSHYLSVYIDNIPEFWVSQGILYQLPLNYTFYAFVENNDPVSNFWFEYAPDGLYRMDLIFTDSDSQPLIISQQLTIDTTPPEFTDADTTNGSIVTFNITDPADSSGNPGSGVDWNSVFIYDMGNNWSAVPFTYSGNTVEMRLPNGQYDLVAYAADNVGNVGGTWMTFSVSVPFPAYSPVQPSLNAGILDTPTAKLDILDFSGTGINPYSITLTDPSDPTKQFNFTVTSTGIEVFDLTDPSYVLNVSCTDNAGNGDLPYMWIFTVNRPVITFTNLTPDSNQYLYNPNPVISGNYASTGNYPIDPATLSITLIDAAGTTTVLASDQITADTSTFIATLDTNNLPAEGWLTVLLTVMDSMGNISDTVQYLIQVDRTPPEIQNPALAVLTISPTVMQFSTSIFDLAAGVDWNSIQIYLDDEPILFTYDPNLGLLDTDPIDISSVPTTEHTITLTVNDTVQNTAMFSWSFDAANASPANPPALNQNPNPVPANGGGKGDRPDMVVGPFGNGNEFKNYEGFNIEAISFENGLEILDNNGKAYTPPQYKPDTLLNAFGNNYWDFPIAYSAKPGNRIHVKVYLSGWPPVSDYKSDGNTTRSVYLRGSTNKPGFALDFPEARLTIVTKYNQDLFLYEADSTVLPPNTVQFFKQLDIKWECSDNFYQSDDTSPDFQELSAKTRHTVYITRDDPINTPCKYQTIYHFACNRPSGLVDKKEIVEKAFDLFEPLSPVSVPNRIKKVDFKGDYYGFPLKYWLGPSSGQNTDTATLIKENHGNCDSFAEFFRDCINLHGIKAARAKIGPKAATASYDIDHGSAITKATFSFLPFSIPGNNTAPNLRAKDFPGQGMLQPYARDFNLHDVVKADGTTNTWFDPSYGFKFKTIEDLANSEIELLKFSVTRTSPGLDRKDYVKEFHPGELLRGDIGASSVPIEVFLLPVTKATAE